MTRPDIRTYDRELYFCGQVYHRNARGFDTNGVGREHLTLYILAERPDEIMGKQGATSAFFVLAPLKKHNILCPSKKRLRFSLFFSGKRKLSGDESCAIMIVTDEFGRGQS